MIDLDYIDKDYLYKFRKSLGLSQPKLAEIFNLGGHTIQRYESGETDLNPSFKMVLYLIAKEPKLLDLIYERK